MSLRCNSLTRRGSEVSSGLRRSFFATLVATAVLGGCTFQRQPPPSDADDSAGGAEEQAGASDAAEAVVGMLHASAESWNRGDLDGFMDDYWRSEALTFSGSEGVTRGWDGVKERYLRSYWAPGAERDSLRFEDLEVTLLGKEHALALGRYVLYRPEGPADVVGQAEESGVEEITSTGFFSLVLGWTGARWEILHDHTSAAEDDSPGPQEGGPE